jgi:hypothetical protein
MEYKRFAQVIKDIQIQDKRISALYKLKVDVLDFHDSYQSAIRILFETIYGVQGYDWISWFMYETDFGKKDMEATDNGKRICYDVKSLWEYLEKNHKVVL